MIAEVYVDEDKMKAQGLRGWYVCGEKQFKQMQRRSGVEFGKMKTQTERATSKAENPQAANPSLQQAKNSYDG